MLLSGVLSIARKAATTKSLKASFDMFDKALSTNKVPVEGKITERLVRSAFSALVKANIGLGVRHLPNPFPSPHNLSWYFGACTCPGEVRSFATSIRHRPLRVWSVAQAAEGWRVLVQVVGEDTSLAAEATVGLECKSPALRLRQHALGSIKSFPMKADNVEAFMHECARGLLAREGLGHFVEVSLDRRSL